MTGEGMFDMDAKGASSITVIDDEDGMLLLGDQLEIDRVLAGRGLVTKGIDAKTLLKLGKGVTELSEHASRSGQWVKLTKESSEALVKYGKTGMQSGVLRGTDGKIIQHLKFMNPGELANPALAAGVGGMMAQYALEQAIEEITDYLKSIDGKLDDLLQDQKDRMAADLGGVARLVDETYAIKREVGVVSDVTWSKWTDAEKRPRPRSATCWRSSTGWLANSSTRKAPTRSSRPRRKRRPMSPNGSCSSPGPSRSKISYPRSSSIA